MQPFLLSAEIERRYGEYIQTSFPLRDEQLAEQLRRKIEHEHLLGTGPILALQQPFAPGETVASLAARGALHPTVANIFPGWDLREHQTRAFERLCEQGGARSTIVATGTGSGKTEAFLLPLLDYCARHPGDGVKALLLYPMNALANDQLERLRGYLNGTGITFGRYTGDTPASDGDSHPGILEAGAPYRSGGPIPREECFSRDAIRRRRPNLLLTGYRMLEYLLVRREDQAIFRPGGAPAALRYLVLDEVHTYAGALGAEVACLVRRLRGHVDRYGPSLTCVGTSATVGDDQHDAVLQFARKLFAVDFDSDALVQEAYAPTAPACGELGVERVTEDELAALAFRIEGGISADEASRLFGELDGHPTVVWLRNELREPQAFDAIVESFSLALRSEDRDAARRQLTKYLLLGTLASDADGALLRPRLHDIHRGLAGASRCLGCDGLLPSGDTVCPSCGSRALPLEVCRQCGQDYLRAAIAASLGAEAATLHTLTELEMRIEAVDDLRDATPSTVRFVRRLYDADPERDDDEDADTPAATAAAVVARVCLDPDCGHVTLRGDDASCARCDGETTLLRVVSVGKMSACAACGYRYGVDREPITALASSTAIGVSILTWLTLARLPEEQRRLLIFADSRQDTAYQAGYLQDVTAEYTWRQLAYRLVARTAHEPHDFDRFWRSLFAAGRNEYSVFSRDNQQRQENDLHFFCVQEFTREASRRTSLENLGLVGVVYRELAELAQHPAFGAFRHGCAPLAGGASLDDAELLELTRTVLDYVRRAGAISDEYATRYWESLDEVRGLDRFNRRPVAFRRVGAATQPKVLANLRPFTAARGRKTAIEEFFRRVGIERPADALAAAVTLLRDDGLFAEVSVGGSLAAKRARDVLAVNTGRMAIGVPAALWRCRNCGTINHRNVRGRCIRNTCEGATIEPLAQPDESNFYVHMYRDATPIRLDVQEHSGQIAGDKREQYERDFRAGKVNVLVASPTLELGVDIGALTTVLLRGLPPSPANYAQRAGRAGRRERIALVNSYAQTLPHDAYFFNHPQEMISGRIPAPQFELENETIVRRHIRSLALEKLERQVPRYMSAFLDLPDEPNHSPEAYANAPLKTRFDFLDELGAKRVAIVESVQRAFIGEATFACLAEAEIGRVIDEFARDLWLVLEAWHDEVRQVASAIATINRIARPSYDEDRRRAQLQRTLGRLTSPSAGIGGSSRSEAYVLGYLANHGFLPSYAFPGDPATLFSRDLDDAEVTRDPLLALREFAPGAIVYVDRKKIRCNGLSLLRSRTGSIEEFYGGVESKYVRCSACGHHALDVWIGVCPACGASDTKLEENRLEARAFRGSADAQITASEERRLRTPFDVRVSLLGDAESVTTYDYEIVNASYRKRQSLIAINSGLRQEDGTAAPFAICLECGDAKPPAVSDTQWEAQHLAGRKHKPRMHVTHLTVQFESDVMTLEIYGLDDDATLTLRNALIAAARVEFQADDGEIEGFDLPATDSRGTTIVLYETVNGGAGYLRRAAPALPVLAARALAIIEHDPPCVAACYQCLLTYYNQRDHDRLDKRGIETVLRDLAGRTAPAAQMSAAEREIEDMPRDILPPSIGAESPIEVLLEAAMRHRLPTFEMQGEILDPAAGQIVSRPDMLFEAQRIAVYADGHDFHSSPEQISNDERIRRKVRSLGYRVLFFSGAEIYRDASACVDSILSALGD